MSTDKSKYNVEYFSGVVKPDARNSYGFYESAEEVEERVRNESKYCKESKVKLSLDKDSIRVVDEFTIDGSATEIGFSLEATNEGGKYLMNGVFRYYYEDEDGNSVMGACLRSDGSALDCSTLDDEGYVARVSYTFIDGNKGKSSIKDYTIADLEPIVEHEGYVQYGDVYQGVCIEDFDTSMEHVVKFISHKVDCKEFIDFVESLKLLKRD